MCRSIEARWPSFLFEASDDTPCIDRERPVRGRGATWTDGTRRIEPRNRLVPAVLRRQRFAPAHRHGDNPCRIPRLRHGGYGEKRPEAWSSCQGPWRHPGGSAPAGRRGEAQPRRTTIRQTIPRKENLSSSYATPENSPSFPRNPPATTSSPRDPLPSRDTRPGNGRCFLQMRSCSAHEPRWGSSSGRKGRNGSKRSP